MNYFKTLFVSFSIFSCNMFSQTTGNKTVSITLPIVTLMDIEPTGNITLNFSAPTEAGKEIGNPIDKSKWINYTSAIASGGVSRRITAKVSALIPGINIMLQAGSASSGGGTLGTSSGQVTLNTNPITIINGIGGAFTGNGINNGHQVTITLIPNNYANLSSSTNNVVITYTITE